ncbi:MAG: 30S ribosomal protein S2 [Patescibacteria group bacterium]|jgi:small subunit ribosomal protein S2
MNEDQKGAPVAAKPFAKLPTLLELLQAGVHFGHQKGRWHPKAKEFIFIERGGVHIIDLEKTLEKLTQAIEFVQKVVRNGGTVLFIGTKRQGQDMIKKYALECGMPYVNERWVGGFFTNFPNVSKLIKRYRNLKEQKESGALQKYTKKEQVEFNKEIEKLDKIVGGLGDMTKVPDAVFILDVKREKTAITEAKKKKVPAVGFCDTNTNPELLNYPIPANDDAINSIDIIIKTVAAAIKEAKATV